MSKRLRIALACIVAIIAVLTFSGSATAAATAKQPNVFLTYYAVLDSHGHVTKYVHNSTCTGKDFKAHCTAGGKIITHKHSITLRLPKGEQLLPKDSDYTYANVKHRAYYGKGYYGGSRLRRTIHVRGWKMTIMEVDVVAYNPKLGTSSGTDQ